MLQSRFAESCRWNKDRAVLAENAKVGGHYQFQRIGYFTLDSDATAAHPVFNHTIQLKAHLGEDSEEIIVSPIPFIRYILIT